MTLETVFGPVVSSRLGRSLGLDLLGAPICSFDCLYCESGRTVAHTLVRKPYVRSEVILEELGQWLKAPSGPVDHITLGGMGEPCLNSEMEAVINGVRKLAPDVPVAVLTNSSLLPDPLIRNELTRCQAVLPSLDTLIPREFYRLNRPCASLSLDDIAQSLLTFRSEFSGAIFLEILLVRGINDSQANLAALTAFCRELVPDRVDVVTMTRPGAHIRVGSVDAGVLQSWRKALGGRTASSPGSERTGHEFERTLTDLESSIISSLKRRPQSRFQLGQALQADPKQMEAALSRLVEQGRIETQKAFDQLFYALKAGR